MQVLAITQCRKWNDTFQRKSSTQRLAYISCTGCMTSLTCNLTLFWRVEDDTRHIQLEDWIRVQIMCSCAIVRSQVLHAHWNEKHLQQQLAAMAQHRRPSLLHLQRQQQGRPVPLLLARRPLLLQLLWVHPAAQMSWLPAPNTAPCQQDRALMIPCDATYRKD